MKDHEDHCNFALGNAAVYLMLVVSVGGTIASVIGCVLLRSRPHLSIWIPATGIALNIATGVVALLLTALAFE